MSHAYICTFILKHPSGGQVITSLFTVADDKDEARTRALDEDVATAEFLSDTSGWTILSEDVREIGEENIEEAAIRVLGWHAPE